MVDLRGMHLKANKALCINFQKQASIFRKAMLISINDGGHIQCCVLTINVCATTNDDFQIDDRYSSLVCQHSLENIINVSQIFIKLVHQPTKPHAIVSKVPNR